MADPSIASWTPINMFAMLRALINNNTPILNFAGLPTNGTSGTFVGLAGPGAILMDYTNGVLYINTGTISSPTWTPAAGNGLGDTQVASGSISSANITGTSAGQLGHANGVVLVPAAAAGFVNQLISGVFSMVFSVAAYTGGGNVSVNISGGGAALTGVVAAAAFITVGSSTIVELVPLAATKNVYTSANGLALVSASAPTQPGTAAGIINWTVAYRRVAI